MSVTTVERQSEDQYAVLCTGHGLVTVATTSKGAADAFVQHTKECGL